MINYEIRDTALIIPEGVTVIPEKTFSRNNNNKIIGKGAFYNCKNLTEIKFSEQLVSIGSGAFAGCSQLKSIRIPDSVNHIGIGAFRWCDHLTDVTLPDSLTVLRKKIFENCLFLEHIKIPESVVKIEEKAFRYANLTEVSLPGVCCIEKKAFEACTKIEKIIISENLNQVCASTFKADFRLKEIICQDMKFSVSKDFRINEIITVIFHIRKFLKHQENADYLSEHFRIVLAVCNPEILKALLLSGNVFTQNNIDESIQYANQMGNYEVQLLLMNYKAQYLGYPDISDKLKL